ncbi:MAG: hypothetical protein AAGA27_03820 [Pseudomonadota bacterium]
MKKPSLDKLVFDALSQLQAFGYHSRSIRRYQSTWKRLIRFAKQHHFKDNISEKLIVEFLEHYGIQSTTRSTSLEGWKKHTAFSIKILWNFACYGYFERIGKRMQRLSVPHL